jgi:hypothetical protein
MSIDPEPIKHMGFSVGGVQKHVRKKGWDALEGGERDKQVINE